MLLLFLTCFKKWYGIFFYSQ